MTINVHYFTTKVKQPVQQMNIFEKIMSRRMYAG